MNRISKIIALLSIVTVLFHSCSKDDYKLDSRSVDPFVRFNFLTTSAGVPLEYPKVNTALLPVNTFENKSVKTLKVPVTLTSSTLKSPVTVNFSSVTSGDVNTYSMNPESQLVFEGNKLTDTIFVSFDQRWKDKQTITLKLENASDPLVHIGNLNTQAPHNIFTITLGDAATSYTFPENQFFIKGVVGEKIDFRVNFPNGFIPSEIENLEIFSFLNGFDYSLTHDDYGNNRSSINYHLTLLENLSNEDVRYQTKITLKTTPNYIANGNTSLTIVKPEKSTRDVLANPASKFYNLSNTNNLTYGVNWFERGGACVWQSFNVQTFPVVVTKDNQNALLYSDKGTANPNDDIYHDAFKIGFNVVAGTNTVNSFNLKRWFPNASTTAAISPGFNIKSALEFFPENGNSKTNGIVLVIPQDITIGTSGANAKSYSIAIEGEGTYQQISPDLFEISFELKLTNVELFGGTVTSKYKIYNKNTFPTVTPLDEPCRKAIDL
ncbi:hypothetical protein [Flavobacterium limi]|uniref:Calx-beta domain-containing protein n=1 Tax=Flavobacterium limi TaxID=2045105 RepID=A0ABQ1TYT7_9FLAO|nr:hypothetical protein [Flavobacterium limi]GGF04910.1 hypothetical protein GCM10011518_12670 [Flavobacterium limi]